MTRPVSKLEIPMMPLLDALELYLETYDQDTTSEITDLFYSFVWTGEEWERGIAFLKERGWTKLAEQIKKDQRPACPVSDVLELLKNDSDLKNYFCELLLIPSEKREGIRLL